MSFGRWLLIHSFSIFLLALLVMAYFFRHELQLEKAYQQLLSVEPVRSVTRTPGVDKKSQHKGSGQPQQSTSTTIKPVSSGNSPSKKSQTLAPGSLVVLSTVNQSQPQIKSLEADLMAARKAYWDKDYDRAIAIYQRLIKQHPDNPDYLGELGNIYYSLNDDQRAAHYYYQTAQIFLRQKEIRRARSLLAPVTALNREMGDQLRQKIRQ